MALRPEFLRPSPVLEPYVSYYFVVESDGPQEDGSPHRVNVLPVPHAQMVFSYGDESFERVMGGDPACSPAYAITGYTTRTVEYSNPGRLGVIMVGFQPWGLQSLLRSPLKEATDRNIELRTMYEGVDGLERSIRRAADNAARIGLIEAFLLRNLVRPALDERMVDAARSVQECGGRIQVKELCEKYHLERRQFLRRFISCVGIMPKLFAQLVRFQSVFEAMDKQPEGIEWSEIAMSAGYYDQAHFINAFRSFNGHSPTAYQARMHRTELGRLFDGKLSDDDPARRMYL